MKLRKFCACGMKLEREVCDEETAEQVLILWRRSHNGRDCAPINEAGYRKVVSRIISRRAARTRHRTQ